MNVEVGELIPNLTSPTKGDRTTLSHAEREGLQPLGKSRQNLWRVGQHRTGWSRQVYHTLSSPVNKLAA